MLRAKERASRTRHLRALSVVIIIGSFLLAAAWSHLSTAAFVQMAGNTSAPARHAPQRCIPARRRVMRKRLFDVTVTLIALWLAAPTMLVIALLVRLKIGGPVIFKQQRPGLHGKPFTMYKFRTMTEARDANGHLLPDAARLTPFGALLRKTSLDELPELFNVLKGDMSLIGPRPLLMQYLGLYTPEQARRHDVRPGITGWAQVNGRNGLSWEEKFALDLFYVENATLWLDLKILVKTVVVTLRRDGVNQQGQATCATFTGSPRTLDGAPRAELAEQQIA